MNRFFGYAADIYFRWQEDDNGQVSHLYWKRSGERENYIDLTRSAHFLGRAQQKDDYQIISAGEYTKGELNVLRKKELAGKKKQSSDSAAETKSRRVSRDDNEKAFGLEELKEQFSDLQETARFYLSGDVNEADVDTAIITAKKVAAIGGAAKKLMDAEIAPFDNRVKVIKAEYQPLIAECRKISQSIKANAEATVLRRKREKEAAARAEQERLEKEQLRIAEEAAKFAEKVNNQTATIEEMSRLAQADAEAAKAQERIEREIKNAGTVGVTTLKATIRKYIDAQIDNPPLFLSWLEQEAPDEYSKMEEAMRAAAVRLYKAGKQPKGATRLEKEKLV